MNRYFLILLGCFIVTLPLEFVFRANVYRRFGVALRAIWLPSAVYLLWDIIATHFNHWKFSPEHASDITLGGLPLEEFAFFLVIPVCALLTYEAVNRLLNTDKKASLNIWIVFLVLYFFIGTMAQVYRLSSYPLVIPDRIFPFYSVATVFAFTLFTVWVLTNPGRRAFMQTQSFFLTIVICLIFMVFVNGFLTILDDPVVSYSANFGGRLFLDIPTEDFFYGTVLISWILLRWNSLTHKTDSVSEVYE